MLPIGVRDGGAGGTTAPPIRAVCRHEFGQRVEIIRAKHNTCLNNTNLGSVTNMDPGKFLLLPPPPLNMDPGKLMLLPPPPLNPFGQNSVCPPKWMLARTPMMLPTFHNLYDPSALPSVMHLPRMDNNGSRNNPRKLGRKLQWYGHTSRSSGLLAHNVMHGLDGRCKRARKAKKNLDHLALGQAAQVPKCFFLMTNA